MIPLKDIRPGTVLWRTALTASGYGSPICPNEEPVTVGYVASGFVELGDPVAVLDVRRRVVCSQLMWWDYMKVLTKSGLVGWVAFCEPHWTTNP